MEILGFSLLAIAFVWFVFCEREKASETVNLTRMWLNQEQGKLASSQVEALRGHLSLAEKDAAFERKRAEAANKELEVIKEANKRAVEARALPFYIRSDEQDAKEEAIMRAIAAEPVYQDEVPGLGR